MNLNSPTVQACIAGTQAEFQGQRQQALSHYQKAWELAQTPEDQCIAAHYLAHLALAPQEALAWNQKALIAAQNASPEAVADFWGSLYVNLGQSYEDLGNLQQAEAYYALAEAAGVKHSR